MAAPAMPDPAALSGALAQQVGHQMLDAVVSVLTAGPLLQVMLGLWAVTFVWDRLHPAPPPPPRRPRPARGINPSKDPKNKRVMDTLGYVP